MANIEYECPVCNAKLNSRKEPFISVRAVALHIANRIKANNTEHRIWAYENCGQEEVDEATAEYKTTNNNNILGDLLLIPVKNWHDDRSKPNIGFKKQ